MGSGKSLSVTHVGPNSDRIYFRDGTSDGAVIQSIFYGNEYRVPVILKPNVILDIGSNIGASAMWLANKFPEAKILCFEPVEENFHILEKNVSIYPNIEAFKFALGKADGFFEIYESDDPLNRGGFSFFDGGVDKRKVQIVEMRYLERFLRMKDIPYVDMIKIDAEGSEYDIITSMSEGTLEKTKFIFGELHGNKDFHMLAYLEDCFDIGIEKNIRSRIGKFAAINKSIPKD